jgi:predicted  nucleic acid-binding Zn-ribbon protein
VDTKLKALLIYQDADVKRHNLETQLAHLPLERERLENKITAAKAQLEQEQASLLAMEVKRKAIDTERLAAEAQVAKYKTQQLAVKKNDEYQALTHEIELTATKISALEDDELALMLELDRERARLEEVKGETARQIALFSREIEDLTARDKNIQTLHAMQVEELEKCAATVDPLYLEAYGQARTRIKKPPCVVPLRDQQCTGCHIRVSNEVEQATSHGDALVSCPNCGRLVYRETL